MEGIGPVGPVGKNYQKPSTGAIIGGVVAGTCVGDLLSIGCLTKVNPKIMKKGSKLSASLTADEFFQIEKAVTDTIKQSGLEAKGVGIIKATAENAEEIAKVLDKECNRGIFKHLPDAFKKIIMGNQIAQLETGQNAFYTFASKKIVVPEKNLGLALFHEMGHAMNANLSKFGKILQKCRPMILLAAPVSMIALWKTKKAPGEEPKNKMDKATTFVKNNAGKLTFATWVPLLLEEGLATLKGNKFARQLLSPDLAKKVAKSNALGFSTYLLLATASALGICLGTKLKDAIASKKVVAENQ